MLRNKFPLITRMLLPLMIVAAFFVLSSQPQPTQAEVLCNPPPWIECIEYTEWSYQNCRCECVTQSCCEFYYPFVPYGCSGFVSAGQVFAKTIEAKH
jgi:hypothetical protein